MRAIFTSVLLFVFLQFANSQTYVFHENFEAPSGADSVVSAGPNPWSISTKLFAEGLQSDSVRTPNGDSVSLVTMSFSTLGSQVAYLEFKHICKIEYFDNAEIWVSANNGVTYTKLTASQYMGNSFFPTQSNAFHDASYVDWQPGTAGAIPTNSWWKSEKFNISSIAANSAQVKVKFILKDGTTGSIGHGNYYGWLIDNITVWTPSTQEASLMAYYLPTSLPSGCGLANETFQVTVKNTGATNINGNLSASFQRVGAAIVTENIPAVILPGDTFSYIFTAKINLAPVVGDTNYQIKTWISLPSDPNQTNDSLSGTMQSRIPLPAPVINDTTISYATNVTLHAIATDSVTWYSDPLAQNQIKYGQYFTTPVLYDTTTYYVQAKIGSANLKFTEIIQNKGGTGATNPFPAWINGSAASDFDGIEITNLGNAPAIMTGYTVYFYSTDATYGVNGSWTFPAGAIIPIGGICILDFKSVAGGSNPSINYYCMGLTGNPQSTSAQGYYLKDANSLIVDVVGTNSVVFPAASGITSTDWSGNIASSSGFAGVSRSVSDNNNASDWIIASAAVPQTFGSLNPTLTVAGGGSASTTTCPSIAKPVKVMISNMPQNDAGITIINSPSGMVTGGVSYPVKVQFKNFGVNAITKAKIYYSVNGVVKPVYNWTGNIAKNQITPQITLGNETFTGGVNKIKAWTSLPNDSLDWANHNDTANTKALVCLNGTYTIGGANPDFVNFVEAKMLLDSVGVCGPVVFNIAAGTYNGQLTFNSVVGASDTNTITFQSATGDSTSVILTYAPVAAADNWTVKLAGASYFRFKNIKLTSTGATYGRVLEFSGGANFNKILNCIVQAPSGTSSTFSSIYSTLGNNNFNEFRNNRLLNGYYNVYWYGSAASTNKGTIFDRNSIEDAYYYGLYVYYADSIQITNNNIKNLSAATNYNLYLGYGNNNSLVQKNKIKSVASASSYGLYTFSSSNGLKVLDNEVDITATSTAYGLYSSANDYFSEFRNNRITIVNQGTCYGLYVTGTDGTSTAPVIFANNMLSQTGGTTNTVYGIYSTTNTYIQYLNNSIRVAGGSTTASRTVYQTGGTNVHYINNILSNYAQGIAFYALNDTAIYTSDYNDIYTSGATLAYWGGANQIDLPTLQSVSNKDLASVSINPNFLSASDLHLFNVNLDGKGVSLPAVTIDIDGETRDPNTPDIGADEFFIAQRDIAIQQMTSPLVACPGVSTPISIKILSNGTDSVKTYQIGWSINGVVQTPFSGTDTILNGGIKIKTIGNNSFLTNVNYNMKFWVISVNGLTDQNVSNDTLVPPVFKAALSGGTYTIGGVNPDFPTLNAAVNLLNNSGICGPVVFNIAPGTYNEQISINLVAGSSAVNTITFKAANGDSSSVNVIGDASLGNYVVRLNGANYVKFESITFKTTSSTSGYIAYLLGGASNNTFTHCTLESVVGATASSCAPVYSTSTSLENNNTFTYNNILNGYYAFYIYGSSTTILEMNWKIENNIIRDYYYYGIYLYYTDSSKVRNNIISNRTAGGANYALYSYYGYRGLIEGNSINSTGAVTNYGIYMYYSHNFICNANKIVASGTGTNYGIQAYYVNSGTVSPAYYTNNSVSIIGGTSTTYGIYDYYSAYTYFINNSINITSGSATAGYAYYRTGTGSTNLINNIFSNTSGGYAYFVVTPAAVLTSDYNNIYTNGATYSSWNGTANANLIDLRTASSKEAHSIQVNPNFITSSNLHTNSVSVNNKGINQPMALKDFDGELRSATTPDIGCDEFTPPSNEVKLIGMYTLGKLAKKANNPHQVMAIIENVGLNSQYNYPVTLTISGANNINLVHSYDSLVSGELDTLLFNAYTSNNLGLQTVLVSLPSDFDTTNNIAKYYQEVTDSVFGMADTARYSTALGYNTGSGLLLAKYYIPANRVINGVNVFITNSATIGKQVYAVMVNKNGVVVDTSAKLTVTANDTNRWVSFLMSNPLYNNVSNDSVYVGMAQVANAVGFFPLGMQKETPARPNVLFGAGLTGGAFTAYQQFGRPMIEAVTGKAPSLDIKAIAFVEPTTGCALSSEIVKLKIKNIGDDTIFGVASGITVGFKLINGNASPIIENVTDTIYPSQEYIHTFASPVMMTSNNTDSIFSFKGFTTLTNDIFHNNDTTGIYSVTSKQTSLSPQVSDITIPYATSGTLTAVSPDSVFWWSSNNATSNLSMLHNFVTPILYDTTTYFADARAYSGQNVLMTLGTGTVVNTTTTYPSAYGQFYTGDKNQYLILASELFAAGFNSGPISSLAFDIVTAAPPTSTGANLNGFTIKMGHTTVSSIATWQSGLTQVFNVPNYVSVVGWNTHNFTTQFVWDGVSNVVIETCYDNYAGASDYSDNAVCKQSTTAFTSTINYHSDAGSVCPYTTGQTVYSQRPNMRLFGIGISATCASPRVPATVFISGTPANDAGAVEIVQPSSTVTGYISNTAQVKIHNYGTANLQSAKIAWSINGIQKPSFNWTGNILPDSNSASFAIGNYSAPAGLNTIKVWTDSVNGVAATYPTNDSITKSFTACISGTFTIGGAGADFVSITDAISRIKIGGICGPVRLRVNSGTYTEKIDLSGIIGLSQINTLTIESFTGNNNDVVIQSAGSSAINYVVNFNGADYVRLQNMTIKNTNSTYGRVIELSDGAKYNVIYGNKLESAGTSSSTSAVIYSSSNQLDEFNVIRKNQLVNGYYGLYMIGTSAIVERSNIIDSNTISGFYYYGIYPSYQDSMILNKNDITGSNAAGISYGIYSYYNRGFVEITNNKIFLQGSSTTYGIAIYYNQFSSLTPGLVANNFVSNINSTGTTYLLYDYYSDFVNIYNNSFASFNGASGTYTAYQTNGSNKNYVNNIFANFAGGYAWYVLTPSTIANSNYNGFFTNGNNLAYWNGDRVNLDSLKANSGKDQNSKFGNPNFVNNGNHHTKTVIYNNVGTFLTSVPKDIDGESRSITTPDIGADEYTPPANDAGVVTYISPLSPVTPTSQAVKIKISNFGTSVLSSATIKWSVNGVPQAQFIWSGSLNTLAISDTINIGNYTFGLGNQIIKLWTINPNNQTDGEPMNDTIVYSVYGCNAPYNGTYTIGGAGASFSDIKSAIEGLKYCGISGPVVLNINPGTYTEQFIVPKIAGSSAINTVTLRSANGNPTSVTITNDANSNANYTIKFDSVQNFKLRSLTIKATNATYGRVIEIAGASRNLTIDSNIILSSISTSSTTAGIYMLSTYKPESITIANNQITNGYYGIYLSSNSTSLLQRSPVVQNNMITNWYYYGAYIYGSINLVLRNNLISNSATAGIVYGVTLSYCDSALVVDKNKIELNSSSSNYGLYMNYCDGSNSVRGLVTNNFISNNGNTGTAYGLYTNYSTNLNFYYNSVNIACGSATGGRAAFLNYGNNNIFKNNNFVNTAASGGYAIYVTTNSAPVVFSNSNYNNLFTTGTNLAYYATAKVDLAAWKTSTLMDTNSISIDPSYFSASNLHASSVGLNGKATPIAGITTDIDGDTRSVTPDIGADEFISYNLDAGIVAFLSPVVSYGPQGNTFDVTIRIKNFGMDTLTNIPLSYRLGSGAIENGIWVGSLPPNAIANYQFGTQGTLPLGLSQIKAWTILTGDQNHTNDSLAIPITGLPLLNLSWSDDFDSPQVIWSTAGLMNVWQHGVPTSTIINAAHSVPNVWKTNLSGQYYNSDTSYLYSPYFNFQNIADATMSFWHRYETQVTSDQCKIQFSQDLGVSWVNLGVKDDTLATNWYNTASSGQHSWTGSSNGWWLSTYLLSQFNASPTPIQFRFQFISNASITSDGWAIDDFKISLPPAPIDAKLDSIISPSSPVVFGVPQTVSVRIKNEGTNVLTSVPVHYSVNGTNFVYDVWVGNLAPLATTIHTFSQTFTPNFGANSFNLCAAVDVAGDPYDQNDSVCYSITQLPPPFDAGVYRIESPSVDTTILGTQYTVKIWFKNNGTSTITAMNLQYKAGFQQPAVEPWTGTLIPGDSASYTFTQKYMPQPAWYQLCAKTILTNDAIPGNDENCRNKYGTVGMEELWSSLFMLDQNIPNPASNNTSIQFETPVFGRVKFMVTDVLGQVINVQQLELGAGRHQVELDVTNFADGLYYYSIELEGHRLVKKLTVIK